MSAESPSRRSRCVPTVIPPQAVSDRSIIDSVTGFINEVALNSGAGPQADAKEQIIWTRFETDADISDLSFGEDWDLEEGAAPPPLILTLGYGTGIQMWAIPANGEAIEVLSWRHGGPVKCLKILPTPLMEFGDQGTAPSVDIYHAKRPLIAIADTAGNIVNFVSLRDGNTVKSIKFKHPVVDILANRTTVVITFQERVAVFDARTFEDRCTVTTCFPSPGLNPNPVALGSRWLAFAELKMMPSKRSNGGCDGLVNTSTMASVISAAKTLGKGLKGIGETIGLSSSSATAQGGGFATGGGGSMNNVNMQYGGGGGVGGGGGGTTGHHHPGLARTGSSGGLSPSGSSHAINSSDGRQPGIVTVMDIKYPIKDFSPTSGTPVSVKGTDPIVAHFVAHPDAIVNVAFDPSGMLLLTADKKGHDFNVFRIYPHPGGPSLAAVHHLYVLHRGDTTAKVQDICFSMDSRWVAVSSLRGTTHVFPITPYGGNVCLRTHGSTQVVNQLSRFHRSAGLSMDGRCSSPVTYSGDGGSYGSQSSLLGGLTGLGGGGAGSGGGGSGLCGTTSGCTTGGGGGFSGGGQNGHYQSLSNAYANPRVPPFAHPTMVLPLTQLRQPYAISNGQQAAQSPHVKDYLFNVTLGRQRHSSLSDDSMMGGGAQTNPLRVCATFARPRAWLLDPPGGVRDGPGARMNKSAMDSLFIMASHGALIQYDLEPKHSSAVVREKVCDDTAIELFVEAKAQWSLLRNEARFNEIQPPLPLDNLLLLDRLRTSKLLYGEEKEAGGAASGSVEDDRWLSRVEIITHAGPHRRLWMGPQFIFKTYNTPSGSNLHHIEMESVEIGLTTGGAATLNGGGGGNRPARSNPMNMPGGERPIVPVFIESGSYSSYEQSPRFRSFEDMDDFHLEPRDSQLREDLADAMRDCSTGNNAGSSISASAMSSCMMNMMAAAGTGNASATNNALSAGTMLESVNARPDSALSSASIENIVNPLGTVTTVVRTGAGGHADPMTDSYQSQDIAFPDQYIHENCDEALFRPVVTIIEQSMGRDQDMEPQKPPARMNTNLIVPVIMPTIPKAPQTVVEEEKVVAKGIEIVAEVVAPPKREEVIVEEFPEPPVVVEVKQTKQAASTVTPNKQQKNKRNKEKTPPVQRQQQQQQNVMTTSSTAGSPEENTKAPTKGNGSKGRKSSGQEPKAGKIRKSERNIEITMSAEEEIKEVELPPPSPPIEEVEVVEDFVRPAEFDHHLPEVETMPSKQEMEIIQDSLMKETIVEAVTVTLGGAAGGKKKKNRQKTPPKAVVPEPEPEEPAVVVDEKAGEEEEEKQEMMVDISETKYDLAECIEGATDAEFDAMYSDPLVPLEPFDPSVTFEAVECPDDDFQDTIHAESLMSFESAMEEAKREQAAHPERNEKLEKLHKVFTDRNLVFAMCTSWREASEESNNTSDTKMLAGDDDAEESVNISSAPGWQLEIHEDYMDMEQSAKKLMIESMKMDDTKLSPVLTASTGSSEGEVSSSSNSDGKTTTSSGHTTTTATEDDEEEEDGRRRRRVEMMNDFDEELQPLIKDKEPMEQFDEDEGGRSGDVEGGGADQMPVAEAMAAATAATAEAPKSKESTPQPQDLIDGSGVLNCFRHLDRMGSGRSSTGGGSGRGSITSSVIGGVVGGGGAVGSGIAIGGGGGVAEDMSSSSFSSTDAPSSPTASYSGENLLHFHGDSSGSL